MTKIDNLVDVYYLRESNDLEKNYKFFIPELNCSLTMNEKGKFSYNFLGNFNNEFNNEQEKFNNTDFNKTTINKNLIKDFADNYEFYQNLNERLTFMDKRLKNNLKNLINE